MRILGIDPGLENTGWGIVETQGNKLSFIAGGTIRTKPGQPMAERLKVLYAGLQDVLAEHMPDAAAVEEVFVNSNARTSLKLGQARGIALLLPALAGLEVAEYSATHVKKALVGTGKAEKAQVTHMVKVLLPTATFATADTSDALAVAVCHSHTISSGMHRQVHSA